MKSGSERFLVDVVVVVGADMWDLRGFEKSAFDK